MRQILDLAYERGYLAKNPHGWITLQKERRPDIDPLSFAERTLFLQTLPERWQPYFIVAFDTGMRPSEQMALHWRHVDFTAKRLLIRQGVVRGKITDLKTDGSWRDIDMLPTVEEALKNLPETRGNVFPNTEGGFLDLTNLRKRVWYPTLKAAGLRPRDLYLCRHTFASLMLQAGEDPAWIARMLGHTTTRMLYERYGKFIKNRTRQDGSAYVEVLKRRGN